MKTFTKSILKSIIKKGENSLIDFWQKSKQEVTETKEAEKVFVKYVEGKEVSREENEIFKNQTFDLIRIIFIGIPLAVVPGFSIIMLVIVKIGNKYKFNVLPSSFRSKK